MRFEGCVLAQFHAPARDPDCSWVRQPGIDCHVRHTRQVNFAVAVRRQSYFPGCRSGSEMVDMPVSHVLDTAAECWVRALQAQRMAS